MRNRCLVSVLSVSLSLAVACGGSSSPTPTTPAAAAAADPGGPLCPMTVPGTSVAEVDADTGGALVFTTTGDPSVLRARVAGWAERHNARHGAMGLLPTGDEAAPAMEGHHHHHHGGAGDAPAASTAADPAELVQTHSSATAVDVDGGARLEFKTFPDQVGALQGELRGHAAHLATVGCGGR